jgi:molybdate transport system substrate-binding protein
MQLASNRALVWAILSVVSCVVFASCGDEEQAPPPDGGTGSKDGAATLTVLCGAGIRPAMQELVTAFEKEHDCRVKVSYAGSGTLLGQLTAGADADVYVPGDVWWLKKAQENGLVARYKVAAWFVPVLGVPKGSEKVKSLADLAGEDIKVGLGRADACAVGNVARELLESKGLADKVKPSFEATTVNRLANQVAKLKTIDVALIWDATAAQYPDSLDVVELDDPYFHAVPLGAGVTTNAKNKQLADEFTAFAASDAGRAIFKRNNYTVTGNLLRVGCGSSMKPPVDELAARFEAETGVDVQPNYGGSGTVLLQIEESRTGDVYICHDPYAYICVDKKLTTPETWHTMAYLYPVIAVPKGNPKDVKGLMDLLRDDLKVGLPHRETSTRGKILWKVFQEQKMVDRMLKRIEAGDVVEDRTHALVNKLTLGGVDVAVLWDAPARAMDSIEAIEIEQKFRVDTVTSATSGKTYPADDVKVTVVRLTLSKEPLLTAQFARLCLSDAGRAILKRHEFRLPPAK